MKYKQQKAMTHFDYKQYIALSSLTFRQPRDVAPTSSLAMSSEHHPMDPYMHTAPLLTTGKSV